MYKDSNGDIWVTDEEEVILQEMIHSLMKEFETRLVKEIPEMIRERMRTAGHKNTYKGIYDRLDRIIYLLERSSAKQEAHQ